MNFGFTEEQDELRTQARRFLDRECSMERVRELMASTEACDRTLWSQVAELGWLGLTVPESAGGLGLAWEDLVILAEELGRSLSPLPVLSHAAAQHALVLLADEAQRERWLAPSMDGALIATLALKEEADVVSPEGIAMVAEAVEGGLRLSGRKLFVPDGEAADLLLVAAREGEGMSLFGVAADAPGLTREALRGFDDTKRTALLTFDGVQVTPADRLGPAGGAWEAIADAHRRAAVAFAAETAGAAAGAIALAVGYAKVREQFGSPIGRFQGVKHKCAEMHVEAESAASLAFYASWVLDHEPENAERYASMAVALAGEAADHAGEEGVQIHGAIGFTWECDAQLYYKRGRYARFAFGAPDQHFDRILAVQGL